MCHCGIPIREHNASARAIDAALASEALYGPTIPVTTPDGTYLVRRSYIALHGITGANVATLGFQRAQTT